MIVGNSRRKAILDINYNATSEQMEKMAEVKSILRSIKKRESAKELINNMTFEEGIIPTVYNMVENNNINMGQLQGESGEPINELFLGTKQELSNILAYTNATDKSKSALDRMVDGLYGYAQAINEGVKENKKSSAEAIKQSFNTLAEEEAKGNKEFGENFNDKTQGQDDFDKWIRDLEAQIDQGDKKMQQLEKYSELQKVSTIEFVKPKQLFVKKLLNKDFYIRKPSPKERKLYVITDNSSSMDNCRRYRANIMDMIYNACKKNKIDMYHDFFNYGLHNEEVRVSYEELNRIKSRYPNGQDNVGSSTYDKLMKMKRSDNRQYLLVISDGTANLGGFNLTSEIMKLCKEKNVDLRFILFTRDMDEYNIPNDNIFYMLKNRSNEDN
jgi:hypothetical protein